MSLRDVSVTTVLQKGQIFFPHDGRTNDLLQGILAHGGGASQVISNFNGLSPDRKQSIGNFLRGYNIRKGVPATTRSVPPS